REWLANDADRATRLLNECPPRRRGWEWHYLKRQGDGSLFTRMSQLPGSGGGVAFGRDGRWLVTMASDNRVRVLDPATGQDLFTLPALARQLAAVAISRDGKLLAAGGGGSPAAPSGPGALRVWDAETRRERFSVPGLTARVTSICFSPDGEYLAGAGGDGIVRVWRTTTGEEAKRLGGEAGP